MMKNWGHERLGPPRAPHLVLGQIEEGLPFRGVPSQLAALIKEALGEVLRCCVHLLG